MQVYNSTLYTDTGKSSISSGSMGKDAFLKILAAELQNQDPMNSGSSTEYIAQMAQFTSLEQIENLNNTISQLLISQKFQEGSSLVGKIAKVQTDDDTYITGEVTGAKLDKGLIQITINGKDYSIDNVAEIAAGESESNALQGD
jgi:flagellar basal-body rod modification protein FlgD